MGGANSGDRLARGANRANFQTTEGKIDQDAWDRMFADYDPEEFRNAPEKSRLRSNSDTSEIGDAGAEPHEAVSEPVTR